MKTGFIGLGIKGKPMSLNKDLANVLDASHELGAPLPLTAAVMEMMQALRTDGLGEADHGGLVQCYEKLAKVEVNAECLEHQDRKGAQPSSSNSTISTQLASCPTG